MKVLVDLKFSLDYASIDFSIIFETLSASGYEALTVSDI